MFHAVFSRIVRSLAVLSVIVVALPLSRGQGTMNADTTARNMILMIGDGMGPAQVRLAGDYAGKPLAMTALPVRGRSQTAAVGNAVTDSAAAGTALACGRKTRNGILGQLPDGTPLKSIALHARGAGKRVGVLTSVTVNHATPAAFYASVPARHMYYEIGLQCLAANFNVLGGRGLSDADGKNHKPASGKSLWTLVEQAGYSLLRTPAALQAYTAETPRAIIIPQSLYAEAGVPYARAFDPGNDITLAQMTAKALELLDNPNGFFLMVEGGAIDSAGHANDAVANIAETLAFDEAVAVAKAFAEAHAGTLLIVTADHETGGLTMASGYRAEKMRAVLSRQVQGLGALASALAATLAAAREAGNVDAGWPQAMASMGAALGLEPQAFEPLEGDYRVFAAAKPQDRRGAQTRLLRRATRIRDAAAGLSWSTGSHTATPVPVYAFGPGAGRFAGTQDNTAIFTHGMTLLELTSH